MDAALASIVVAVITAGSGIIVAFIQKFRRENQQDHGAVMEAIKDLHNDIHQVDEKIDGHIIWHLNDKKEK